MNASDRPRVHQVVNGVGGAVGGAERIALALHRVAGKHGWESRLVTLTGTGDTECRHNTLGLGRPHHPDAVRRLAKDFKRNVRSGDLVHAHLFPSNLYVAAASVLSRTSAAMLTTEHNTTNRRRGTWWGWALDRWCYQRYDRVACISEATRQSLAAWQPGIEDRLEVIENGAELRFSEPTVRAPTDVPIIVSIGSLSDQKNYGTALEALATITEWRWRYRIAGAGPLAYELNGMRDRLGLRDRVEFLGHVAVVAPLLRESDLFLMPSRWEGFGLAVVEAMNAGLPVVAGDVPGLRDVVGTDGSSGLLVAPDDRSGLAGAIMALLDDPAKREALGRSGFERAKRFDRTKMLNRYFGMYNRLTANQSTGMGAMSRACAQQTNSR